MRQLDQIYRHGIGPRDVPCGDCFRTCLAMLLDAPDPEYVPHFVDMTMGMRRGGYHTQRLARQWLRDEHSLDLVSVRAEDLPSTPFIADVASARHFVVMSWDGSVYADPNPNRRTDPPFTRTEVTLWLGIVLPYEPDPDTAQRIFESNGGYIDDRWPGEFQVVDLAGGQAA